LEVAVRSTGFDPKEQAVPPDLDTAILCQNTGICQVFIDTLFGTAFYVQVIDFVPEVTPKTLRTVELQ
jgi:hypothetical protein